MLGSMGKTNVYVIASDIHARGQKHIQHRIMDPLKGQLLGLAAPPMIGAVVTPATLNCIVRGVVSGSWGRVVRVLDSSTYVLESFPHPIVPFPGGSFQSGLPFGEQVTIDNGAVANVSFLASTASYPLFQQFSSQLLSKKLNEFVPADQSDNCYWYGKAKYSRQIVLTGASVAGDATFIRGYKFTTSAGASGTILLGNVLGANYSLQVIKCTGTFTPGDTMTIPASGETAIIGSVGIDPPQGAWLPHHCLPNLNGSQDLWEYPPSAQSPDFGPGVSLVRLAHEFHVADEDPDSRGVRVLPFQASDFTDTSMGGITVQVVKCSGTFPTNWIAGETVTSGTWSATVHGFSATNKYLFVTAPNGQVLAAGTVTAAISGATATSTGAAFGWQKGSTHWNALVAEYAKAAAADNALTGGQPAYAGGLLFMPWDSDVNTFSTTVGAAWPAVHVAQAAWIKLAQDLRTYFGREDMPITVWQQSAEALPTVTAGGYTYSLYLRLQIDSLPALIPKLTITRSDGFEFAHDPTLLIPTPSSPTYARTMDYITLGERAWRGLRLYNEEIPMGTHELFPIILVAGQSQQVGNIPSGAWMALDRDPALYPSATFPGVQTLDSNVLSFNTLTNEWEVFDIATNANHFYGMGNGTFGPETPLMARQKARWSKVVGESGRIGLIKLAVSATSANAASVTAPATWDPTLTISPEVVATCTVTVIAPTMISPARGRFTATAGTFSSGWVAGSSAFISGSALGIQGFGGNNTAPQSATYIAAVGGDGSWVEFYGTFAAEGPRSFTLSSGPRALAPLVEDAIRTAFDKASDLRLIPYPVLLVWENGEGDVPASAGYEAALLRVMEWLERILGGRLKGQTPIAKVVVQLSDSTPAPVGDPDVAAIRAAQVNVVAALENATLVDPTNLPQESSGTWPVLTREDHGLHRTARGHIMAGYLVDEASGTLEGIPEHPGGSAAVDFGADGSGASSFGSDTVDGGATSEDSPVVAAAVDLTASTAADIVAALDAAIASGGDVAAYTVDGQTVQLRSIESILQARKYYDAQRARKQGMRRTLAQF